MKKITLFSFMLLVGTIQVRAQLQGQLRLDSLLVQLKTLKADTNKVKLLNDLSSTYYSVDPDEGLKYGNLGLELSKKLKWKKGMASAFLSIGVNYWSQSDYPKALEYQFEALKINEELGDNQGIARTLSNIGLVYSEKLDRPKALTYYFRALKINETLGDKKAIAKNLTNIGTCYFEQSDFIKALDYDLQALKLNEELGNKKGTASVLSNIGTIYIQQNDYSKALEYFFKAMKMKKEIGDKAGVVINFFNIGSTYLSLAKDSITTQLNLLFNGKRSIALLKAKKYTDSAIILDTEMGTLDGLYEDYWQLSEIQALMGDHIGALESYKEYSRLKDSVFNMEKENKLTETAMQYEFDKKEAATKATQEKKDIQQRNIRNSIVGVLAGALLILFLVYRQRNKIGKEKKKSDALLLNILPAEVAEELKQTGEAEAKQFNHVTVLFTDFVNFTGISESMNPKDLVAEIHKNFKAFDEIIEKYGLEKIKTIGDAYMAVCGLPKESPDHALRTLKAAIEIRDLIGQVNSKFQIRIGINSGPVVAGIVGVKKYAYDIWGDTVNTANRMEQHSEAGKINISGATYELVSNNFTCTYRGKIEAKNKGMIDMYFVEN